jgi:beta-lactam-binding protein with PASTA domain
MAAGLLIFVGIIAISIFFITVRGAEQTMVPDVRGKEITAALLELQLKELYPRIQLRYSQTSYDKGQILEQEPRAGTIVKAGRRIRLVVSDGVMLNSVENYIGRNIDEVRMDLQTLLASAGSGSSQPLLSVQEPFMYKHSSENAGVILEQSPEQGSEISGPTILQFVVSLGPENTMILVPRLNGLSIAGALEQLGRSGMNFTFTVRRPVEGEKSETVVVQSPSGDTTVKAGTVLDITVASPTEMSSAEVFNLFKHTIPANPYPLPTRLDAILPSGERQRIITVEYPGGDFTVPYKLPVGPVLVLSMVNREIYRETVSASTDTLFLDQL